jgi:hypothetical protein
MRPLKVYGWNEDGVHRCIVAAPSWAAAHRAYCAQKGLPDWMRARELPRMKAHGCETGNARELEIAHAAPLTVFRTKDRNPPNYVKLENFA